MLYICPTQPTPPPLLTHPSHISFGDSLENIGAEDSCQVEGIHAILLVPLVYLGEEVAQVLEQAVVQLRELLQKLSHVLATALLR